MSTTKKPTSGQDKGAKGRVEEWVGHYPNCVARSYRSLWFGDGSCDNGNCGGGIVMAYSDLYGWFISTTKSVDRYQGTIPWMPRWADVVC